MKPEPFKTDRRAWFGQAMGFVMAPALALVPSAGAQGWGPGGLMSFGSWLRWKLGLCKRLDVPPANPIVWSPEQIERYQAAVLQSHPLFDPSIIRIDPGPGGIPFYVGVGASVEEAKRNGCTQQFQQALACDIEASNAPVDLLALSVWF